MVGYNHGVKQVDQLLPDGTVIQDYDQPIRPKEIGELFFDLFGADAKQEGKQHILFERIAVLVAAITYLGNPWEIYKKRIQLKDYYPQYFNENLNRGMITLFLGIYRYRTTMLFVLFDPAPYVARKSHNSSAHVQTFDLQYALKKGKYQKVDANGNRVLILDPPAFIEYVREIAQGSRAQDYDSSLPLLLREYFTDFALTLPKDWRGVDCIEEMRLANDANWRQGEWHGFYFEYLFKKFVSSHSDLGIRYLSDKTKTGIDFDIVLSEEDWVFGDLKADKEGDDILGNTFESFDKVILDHNGEVYYIVLRCRTEPDKNHNYETTKYWNQFRDEDRQYTGLREIAAGYGKRMKYSVSPVRLLFLRIDKTAYELLKKDPFHQGKNSNGKERKGKLKIGKAEIDALSVYSLPLKDGSE